MAAEDSVAQDQIKAFVERILRLKEEGKAIAQDIREIYAEAKGNGFDKTVLGKLVNYIEKRANDAASLAEADAIFDLYLTAYDSASGKVGTVRATHTHASEAADDEAAEVAAQKSRLAALRADPAMAIVSATEIKKSEPQSAPKAGSDLTDPKPLGQVATQSDIGMPISNEAPMEVDGDSVEDAMAPLSETVGILPGGVLPDQLDGVGQPPAAQFQVADKSVSASALAAPAPKYAEPGRVVWEGAPPEGVIRHDYSQAFGEFGQDMAVIEDDMQNASSAPIVKLGCVILDGWARYLKARELGIEYPVVQYDGSDSLIDVIRWNVDGRLMSSEQKFRVCQKLAKAEPKRKADIYAAFELGMELA